MKHICILFALVLIALPLTAQANQQGPGIVAFLTDWGYADYFAGACKGVMLAINPGLNVVDICHGITPFAIDEGAYQLLYAARYFPGGTVFLAVVDPGVGTERRPIAVRCRNGSIFVAPDNGLLTLVYQDMGIAAAHALTNTRLFRGRDVSTDFHGRDIFAPVAAHLASGAKLADVGPAIEPAGLVRLAFKQPEVAGGVVTGSIIFINHYGNIICNIGKSELSQLQLAQGDSVEIHIAGSRHTMLLGGTYGDVPEGDLVCFANCNDNLEIAVNLGNAGKRLAAKVKGAVVVKRAPAPMPQ